MRRPSTFFSGPFSTFTNTSLWADTMAEQQGHACELAHVFLGGGQDHEFWIWQNMLHHDCESWFCCTPVLLAKEGKCKYACVSKMHLLLIWTLALTTCARVKMRILSLNITPNTYVHQWFATLCFWLHPLGFQCSNKTQHNNPTSFCVQIKICTFW